MTARARAMFRLSSLFGCESPLQKADLTPTSILKAKAGGRRVAANKFFLYRNFGRSYFIEVRPLSLAL
jgi:hypothetical protein